jgi:hypothetical protein
MKARTKVAATIAAAVIFALVVSADRSMLVLFQLRIEVKASSSTVEGWAAILDMNDFPIGWSDMPMDFINAKMVSDTLMALGWQPDHLHVKLDNLTIDVVKEAVEWLANRADSNDIALLYIFTHGSWIREKLLWNMWFPEAWQKVNTSKRVLMIDSCSAGEFVEPVRGDSEPHVSLAHCAAGESGWAGIEEEGLPIIGSVWLYYFTDALRNSAADLDKNGFVSVEEAFNFSTPLMQLYMNETVFEVPDFLEMYHDFGIFPETYEAYPHPVMDDQYVKQLHLDLDYYKLLSDLNGDGMVSIQDIILVALAYSTRPEEPNWNALADLDRNGVVNILDISIVARDCGKTV